MDSQLSCPLCNFQYAQQKTPRILSMCGHTFCQTCIETLILSNGQDKFKIICPEDEAVAQLITNSLKQFPINKALLKIIQSNKSKNSFKDNSFDVSKIAKQQQMQEDEETKQLITAIKQSQQSQPQIVIKQTKQQGTKEQQQQNQSSDEENLCLLHQKPLQVVCVVDLEKICAKCAIFGQHKGHQFKSIQQIQQQNNAFYHDLLAIYDQKTQILARVQSKETKIDILAILTSNRQSFTKQIKQRFKKLFDIIKNQQKKALLKLEKIIQKVQKDIDDLYKIDHETIQKYEEWQRNSYQKLQIIQKGSFQQKLQLILIDQSKKQKNILIKGKSIVEKIKAQQDNIINKAQVFLSNISIKTNDKIFQFTQSFVQLFEKPPELLKAQVVKSEQQKISQDLMEKQFQNMSSSKKHSQDMLLYGDTHHQQSIKQFKLQKSEQLVLPIQSAETKPMMKSVDDIKIEDVKFVPSLQSKMFEENIKKNATKANFVNSTVQQLQKTYTSSHTSRQNSFVSQKVIRPPKKKLKSIKVPQKYQKVLESLFDDKLQTLDLTNAQLGDAIILQLCQFIPGTKIKSVKFIRNKLSDDSILKMLPYLTNVITLNLSQNLLTERVLDIFIDHREMLPKVKNIILSLNKIIQRKHKHRIDELRKFDITVSV